MSVTISDEFQEKLFKSLHGYDTIFAAVCLRVNFKLIP